ncbi:unnamed protein product, partial [marine sediment metagenome]
KHLQSVEPYFHPDSSQYKKMIKAMEKDLNVTSLKYQRLEDMLAATEVGPNNLCTYCWTGREFN